MGNKKNILCVLNTFFNYEHIKECFDSLYTEEIDFFILENKSKFIDVHVQRNVRINNGFWVKTLINKAKHLTWDYYYYDGNEYYEWKKLNRWTLGVHDKKTKFTVIK